MTKNYADILIGVVLICACSVLFFHDLGKFPIYQWDEARYANNSLEMFLYGDLVNVKMDKEVDLWNFKPPLVLWLQAFCMQILGPTEWAVRLPSALAGLGVVVMMFWFGVVELKSRAIGIISSILLVVSGGFMSPHVARSGDLDAVLTFFLFAYSLVFLRFLFHGKKPGLNFGLLAFLITCAFLCKGVQGFKLLPYLLLISLLNKNYGKVFLHPSPYIFAVMTILICGAYYWVRDLHYPGYWELLKASEFTRFDPTSIPWHVQPFDFYFQNFIRLNRFYPFIYFMPLMVTVIWTAVEAKILKFSLYLFILTIGYFLFISIAPIKLEWYDAPLYPFMNLLLAITIVKGCQYVGNVFRLNDLIVNGVMILMVTVIIWYPIQSIWQRTTFSPEKVSNWEHTGVFLLQLRDVHPDVSKYSIFKSATYPEHLDQAKFYQRSFRYLYDYYIEVKRNIDSFAADERIVLSNFTYLDSIQLNYDYDTLFVNETGILIEIK